MGITRARFEQGMTYQQYKDSMTRNREPLEANETKVVPTAEELAPFTGLPQPLNVLVLAEDWCGDVIANLPILARLAKDSGKLNLRVFARDADENQDLMAQFMNGEFKSIPVFAFFDEGFNEVGRWIERPASVTALRRDRTHAIYERNPEFGPPVFDGPPSADLPEEVRLRVSRMIQQMRLDTKDTADHTVIRELGEVVSRTPAR